MTYEIKVANPAFTIKLYLRCESVKQAWGKAMEYFTPGGSVSLRRLR